MSAALKRFGRVFLAGALVGGIAALRGDVEFSRILLQYAFLVPVIMGLAKFVRDRLGWTWLPI